MKKKYVFISNMAAPYQVKFCSSLQKYFETEFWFYEYIDETRPSWWKIPLGNKCNVLKRSGKIKGIGYYSINVFVELFRFKPDIIILGGFMKWNALIMFFSKLLGAKVAIMSEPIRDVKNDNEGSDRLISKEKSLIKCKILRKIFQSADLYIGMGEIAKNQFINEFDFPKEKVTSLLYPQDIEEYYNHDLRKKEKGEEITLLFANRLVERYQPLMALEIMKRLSFKYKNIKMLINAEGEQKKECIDFIEKYKLDNIKFIGKINSWNEMNLIYKKADILILPCIYSNGNGTLIEAGASGMGLVVSNKINNVERHIRDKENCFVCNLEIDEFVEAISKYIDSPELLEKHGKLSRELVKYARNDFMAKEYFNVLKKYKFI